MQQRARAAAMHLARAAGLLVLSIYATWPAAAHLGDFLSVPDPQVQAWNLWWTSRSVLDLQNPWHAGTIFAPDGAHLGYHTLLPTAGVLLMPVTLLLGAPLTVNLLKLVMPVVAVYCCRALARQLGIPEPGAWVAGLMYGFSTILCWRIVYHLNFGFALPFLPLLPLLFLRYAESGRTRTAVGAGVLGALFVLTDPSSAVLAAYAVGLCFLVHVLGDRAAFGRWVKGVAVAGAVAMVGSVPQLLAMRAAADAHEYRTDETALVHNWVGYNTNLLTMLSPGRVRDWVPGHLERWWAHSPPNTGEAIPAYGWAPLALAGALLALTLVPRLRVAGAGVIDRRGALWAAAVLGLSSLLALGPELTIRDRSYVPFPMAVGEGRVSLLMPYTWFVQLPGLAEFRIPSRFTLIGVLGLSLLAGAGAAALYRRGVAGRAVLGIVLAFALVEAGYPDGGDGDVWVPVDRPALYEPIKADRTDSVVVDVPLMFGSGTESAGHAPDADEAMFYQIQHGHPVAAGYVSRLSNHQINSLLAHPFYAALIKLQDGDGAGRSCDAAVRRDIAALQARWVLIWPQADRAVVPFVAACGFRHVRTVDGIELWSARA